MTRSTGPQDGVRLEVWFDFACPWCFIAERRVRRALERASVHADAVRWRPGHDLFDNDRRMAEP